MMRNVPGRSPSFFTDTKRRLQENSFEYSKLEPRQLLAGDVADSFTPAPIAEPFEYGSVDIETLIGRSEHRPFVPGELVVAIELPRYGVQLAPDWLDWSSIIGVEDSSALSTLMSVEYSPMTNVSLVHVQLGEQGNLFDTMRYLDTKDNVLWSSPNFYQTESPLEFTPNDPDYGNQYHHPLMENDLAWDTTLGDPSIIVAITDDGVDLSHPDLAANIYVNPGEIPGDGIDNDANGYVDDISGWDFPTGNNDANPNGSSDNHGTHVAGITAADTNNGVGVAGTAGGSTIMPLQFYNYNNSLWTAALINETFGYAVDNGAHIINTSYNIDSWVGDPVFTAGLDYIELNERIHFNSSGNNGQVNPPRQVFENTILVANSWSNDGVTGSSNIGSGIDIVAPGTQILSTVQGGYAEFTGTSMATPNAAGVAALIWSAHPDWTRDQVVAQLYATADNIDAQNSSIVGLMGAGRVNSFQAVTAEIGAPSVESVTGLPANGTASADLTIFDVDIAFTQYLDPATVANNSNYELREAGADKVMDTADDLIIPVLLDGQYQYGTNDVTLNFNGSTLGVGDYRLTLSSGGLQNPFGTPLDGDSDGTGGDDFTYIFTLEPPPPTAIETLGSLVYRRDYNGVLTTADDVGLYSIELDSNQKMTVVVNSGDLSPVINVTDPEGNLIGDTTGAGNQAWLNNVPLELEGEYIFSVASDTNTTGPFSLSLLFNAGVEIEEFNSVANDSLATAENLEDSSIPLGSGAADRLAVIGRLPTADGTVIFEDDFESTTLGASWSTYSDSLDGRIQVTGAHGQAAGDWALTMDQTNDGVYNLNEAIWTVDVSGSTNPSLAFFYTNFNDEIDNLPLVYSGRENGDGISISDDGLNWYRVWTPIDTGSGTWIREEIDLASAAAAAGLLLTSDFQIKFQQYDNFSIDTDGLGFDELEIIIPDSTEDWYKFTLADGQAASLNIDRYQDNGLVDMELYDATGTLLATATDSDNSSKFIDDFFDTTTDGQPDEYFVRVVGNQGEYNLVVTRGAQFDREPNDSLLTPQSLTGRQGVLGHLSSFEVVAGEPDDFAPGDVLNLAFPGVTLSNPVTNADVIAEVAGFTPPTGGLVFAPLPGSPQGWREGDNVLRADFESPQSFVSIDVGSDDQSDIGFLRAYDEAGTLLAQVVSGGVTNGNSETLTITRPTADIFYIQAAGVGGDITPLDNLQYSVTGRPDVYAWDVQAGDEIHFSSYLPGDGPFLFDNALNGTNGSELRLSLWDPQGNLVATGTETLLHTASLTGQYLIEVTAENGLGEYYLERDPGVTPPPGIDFGLEGGELWSPYVQADTGAYDPAVGYGWLGSPTGLNIFELSVGNALAKDKATLRNGTFVVDVPNGTYNVDIHLGVNRRRTLHQITLEGVTEQFFSTLGPDVTFSFNRVVTDGQLTLEFDGSLALDRRIRIAGIGISESSFKFLSLAPSLYNNPATVKSTKPVKYEKNLEVAAPQESLSFISRSIVDDVIPSLDFVEFEPWTDPEADAASYFPVSEKLDLEV